jgi:hypothetical protein
MGIIGKWKVTDANVFGKDFKQTWRKTEDVLADESVHPMQRGLARTVYVFEEDGRALTLLPKGIVPAGEAESYDDDFDLAHAAQWKEEGGRLFISTIENDNIEWNEIVPDGEGYIVLGMHRIVKM